MQRWQAARDQLRVLPLLTVRALREFRDDHCQTAAAAISYHVLFSIFPLALASVGVLGIFTGSHEARTKVANAVIRVVPLSDGGKVQVHHLFDTIDGSAGTLGLIGVVGVLFSASGVMGSVRRALNMAWDTEESRPFAQGKLIDLALVVATVAALGGALFVSIALSVARRFGFPGPLRPLRGGVLSVVTYALAALLIFATFLFLYSVVPAVPTTMRQVWPGALLATAGFELTQSGFSLYVSRYDHYSQVYGSLGAVIASMLFVYLASMVFLLGAEVASEYPRLTRVGHPF